MTTESEHEAATRASGAHARKELEAAIWPADRPVPTRTVKCRHCGERNRVQVPSAAMSAERHHCGSCDERLFLGPDEPLTALAPIAYQHSLDRRSIAALDAIPGAPLLVRWLLENVAERGARVLFMSDAILCNDDQFPELVALLDRACARLDIDPRPTMFLGESPHMNALTMGVKEPVIMVRSALLDQMSNDELVAILGHELGHLHAEHSLYQSLAVALLQGGAAVSQMVRLVALPIQRTLLRWLRCAELTADRAALLASRDLGACISMMLTFAGGNRPGISTRTKMRLAPFIDQCRELAKMQAESTIDDALGMVLTMDRTHPYMAWRVMHLIQWVEHGGYLNILSGTYPRRKSSSAFTRTRAPLRGRAEP